MMMDCQYVATQRGGVALVFEGHRYNKVRDGKDGTVYWRCSRDRQCPGRAVTVHSRIKKANNKHNHSPDNGVKSGQTLISSSQIGELTQLGAAVGNHAMAQSLQGLNCNANSVAAMAAILGQGNNVTAQSVAALLQHNINANGTKHSNGLMNNNSLLALGGSAHASLSQHSSSSASSSPFQLDSSENGAAFNFPTLKQLNQQMNQLNGSSSNNNSTLGTFNSTNGQSSSLPNSPLDSMLALNNQNDFSVLQQLQLQNNLQNSHRSQQALLNNHSNHRSSANHLTSNNQTNNPPSRENSSRDNSSNNSCNNSNNSSTSGKTVNGISGKQSLLEAQTNAQLINELKLNSLMSLNSLVKNAVANQSNCNLNNLSNSLHNLNSLTNLSHSLNALTKPSANQQTDHQNSNQNSINNCNGENGGSDPATTKSELNGTNGLLQNSTASQLNNLLLQMEQMNQLSNTSNLKEQNNTQANNPSQTNGSPVLNGNDTPTNDATIQTLNQLNNLLNNNLNNNSLNNKLQTMLAFPSLVNETLKYFSTSSPVASQIIGQLTSNTNQNNSKVGLNEDDNQLMTDYFSDSSDEEQEPLNMAVRNSGQLVRKLRQLMKNLNYVPKPLQAYIVLSCDAHQSEYIARCDERREFITNFTGSCGTAIITHEESLLWTDGRYFEQAERQLDSSWILMKESQPNVPSQSEYLSKSLPSGSKVGVDAKLFRFSSFKDLNNVLNNSGIELVPMMDNLVDLLWTDKPDRPLGAIEPLDLKFAGLSWQQKVQDVRQSMQQKDATILVLTALDDTAWLFNLRGSDVPFNPVFLVYTILTQESIYLFVEEEQLSSSARKHLGIENSNKQLTNKLVDDSMTDSPLNSDEYRVHIKSYNSIFETFKDLLNSHAGKVWISKKSSYALVSLVPETRHIHSPNPVVLKKLVKNDTEIVGMRNAHIKDAVAICEFFAWLEEEIPKGTQTELSAAMKLYEMRKEQCDFIQNSFDTISSSGPNGAVIHYMPTETTNRSLNVEEIYLCDSGAQYLDGTTDVTRAMHFGTPSEFERNAITRVVKGHINLANCIFPVGCKGHSLDILARKALWEFGLDYLHGTGHGVGCYLNVHEGPIHIGPRSRPDDPGLAEGMILSNEPGYYEKDKFGIRIESLMLVRKKETPYNFNNKGFLCFDTITLVPIQTKLLEPSLLTLDEIEWLDNYHQACREIVGDALKKQGKTAGYKWLMKETEPLG